MLKTHHFLLYIFFQKTIASHRIEFDEIIYHVRQLLEILLFFFREKTIYQWYFIHYNEKH